ncbi:HNH endonuclease family protein [Streptosporangium subroseum]|uniref:HNH endonuclease family protein n=1 Tax=Streptosporangium subroseum TaxID=106412 RepID=UPI003087517C|nr:HNH endonuclease family protein [Streptosporangium subroseum]
MRRVVTIVSAALAAILALSLSAGTAEATPPGIPSASTAASRLAALTVAAESHASTYNRDLFPHWITISGSCDTREQVLKRDGTNVVTSSSCSATSGRWFSPYDGATWTAASDVDIDHMVPLAEAWRSGAWAWTTAKRQSFANSLNDGQLWAVTDNVNQSKSDQDPSTWKPSVASFRCTYARAWIGVKSNWGLSLQSAEKTALQSMLAAC